MVQHPTHVAGSREVSIDLPPVYVHGSKLGGTLERRQGLGGKHGLHDAEGRVSWNVCGELFSAR